MDFQQGLITTIHEYGVTGNLLKELNKRLKKRSTSILIPCLYEEFKRHKRSFKRSYRLK